MTGQIEDKKARGKTEPNSVTIYGRRVYNENKYGGICCKRSQKVRRVTVFYINVNLEFRMCIAIKVP